MGIATLDLRPGVGLGPFSLGMAVCEALAEVEAQLGVFDSIVVNYSHQEPLSLDIVIAFPHLGFRLCFDPHVQRLHRIDVADISRLHLRFGASLLGGPMQAPTFAHVYSVLGPTFPGAYTARSACYTLAYPGMALLFPIPAPHQHFFQQPTHGQCLPCSPCPPMPLPLSFPRPPLPCFFPFIPIPPSAPLPCSSPSVPFPRPRLFPAPPLPSPSLLLPFRPPPCSLLCLNALLRLFSLSACCPIIPPSSLLPFSLLPPPFSPRPPHAAAIRLSATPLTSAAAPAWGARFPLLPLPSSLFPPLPSPSPPDLPLQLPDGSAPRLSRVLLHLPGEPALPAQGAGGTGGVGGAGAAGSAGGEGGTGGAVESGEGEGLRRAAERFASLPLVMANGAVYMEALLVQLGEAVLFSQGGQRIAFGDSAQDVWSELGRPCFMGAKQDSAKAIHSALAPPLSSSPSSPLAVASSPAHSPSSGPPDYIWSYYTRGLDIIFSGQSYEVRKLVLHTNLPGQPDFNDYVKCNFRIPAPHAPSDARAGTDPSLCVTPDSKWDHVQKLFGGGGRAAIQTAGALHRAFGPTFVYGFRHLAFEITYLPAIRPYFPRILRRPLPRAAYSTGCDPATAPLKPAGKNSIFRFASVNYNAGTRKWGLATSANWTNYRTSTLGRVRDQGSCGSSWAMAAVTAVELAYAVSRNASDYMQAPRYLSTQQVLSCGDSKTGNCTGGWPTTALDYVVKTTGKYGGMVTEGNYPYTGNTTCTYGTKGDDDSGGDKKKPSSCDTSKVKKKATAIGIRSYESIDYYGWLGLILAVQVRATREGNGGDVAVQVRAN
ncbi:unnamed protein product [Closterium sp. Naga37s-1]|nr:unnamed protein product [Closterium sp. Naga37s-1]